MHIPLPELFAEAWRALKRDSHFSLFCDPEKVFIARPLAEATDFRFWMPIVWDKQHHGATA